MLNISKIFNLTKSESDVLTHGGNILTSSLTMETINLYINVPKCNLFIYTYYFLDDININYIFNLLNDPNLIGVNVSLESSAGYHAISFYKCNDNQKIYDDNLLSPINNEWKNSLIELLKLKKLNIKKDIYYLANDIILNKFNLYQINEIIDTRETSKFNSSIEDKVRSMIEHINNQAQEFLKKNPDIDIKTLNIPSKSDIEQKYINEITYKITNIKIVMKIPNYDSEYDFIINKILISDINQTNVNIIKNRIFKLKNIDKSNNNKIIELIDEILTKNININYLIIYTLYKLLSDNQYNKDELLLLKIKNIHLHSDLFKNPSFFSEMQYDIPVMIYVLFLNNEFSEKFLDKLTFKQHLIHDISFNQNYEYYIFDGRDIIKKNIYDANKIIPLINNTNNEFKQEIIDAINKIKR
jgi:hypothetical protein